MSMKKQLIKAGATLSLAAVFAVANQTEADAFGWTARSVEQIEAEIQKQADEQNGDETVKYTIQWGDTLSAISEATDISVEKLADVNDISNVDNLITGNTLYLSQDNTVLSVEDENHEVTSYNISEEEEEVKEVETPQNVEEQVKETPQETEEVVEEAPAQEAEPVEETQEPSASASSSSQAGNQVTVEATAYSRNQGSLSNHTADGTDLRQDTNVIAVDPNVIPLGSTVEIPGHGTFRAADTGGAIKGNRIDIHMEDLGTAQQFGRKPITVNVVN